MGKRGRKAAARLGGRRSLLLPASLRLSRKSGSAATCRDADQLNESFPPETLGPCPVMGVEAAVEEAETETRLSPINSDFRLESDSRFKKSLKLVNNL